MFWIALMMCTIRSTWWDASALVDCIMLGVCAGPHSLFCVANRDNSAAYFASVVVCELSHVLERENKSVFLQQSHDCNRFLA
jgi:hypothetical protein